MGVSDDASGANGDGEATDDLATSAALRADSLKKKKKSQSSMSTKKKNKRTTI